MKKMFLLLVPLFALPFLAACKQEDYSRHLSDVRSDIFVAETEEFSLAISCITRETPYAADGVACNTRDMLEIVLKPSEEADGTASYSAALHGTPSVSGELSYRSVRGDYYLSQGVTDFPEGSVTVRITKDGETQEVTAASVKSAETLTPKEALNFAVGEERELIGRMTSDSGFQGEFQVRLLRRNATFYYVGIIGKNESAALLLDAETGEVLARRVR